MSLAISYQSDDIVCMVIHLFCTVTFLLLSLGLFLKNLEAQTRFDKKLQQDLKQESAARRCAAWLAFEKNLLFVLERQNNEHSRHQLKQLSAARLQTFAELIEGNRCCIQGTQRCFEAYEQNPLKTPPDQPNWYVRATSLKEDDFQSLK